MIAAECYADGLVGWIEIEPLEAQITKTSADRRNRRTYALAIWSLHPDAIKSGREAVWSYIDNNDWRSHNQLQCEIFGNPFRAALLNATWLQWNDNTVQKMAKAIYIKHAFDRLPILADALEEAGCNNAEILDHCRSPGPHVRGCWVVDLLLGKG